MTENNTPDTIRYSGDDPTALVALARALLNVHPDKSLVMIGIGSDNQVKVTVRVDLTTDTDEQASSAAELAAICQRAEAVAAIAVTFHPQRLDAYAHRAQLTDSLADADVTLVRAMHVDDTAVTTDDGQQHSLPSDEQITALRRRMGAPEPTDRAEKVARLAPIKDQDVTNQVAWLEMIDADPTTAASDLEALCCLHLATGEITPEETARYLLNIAQPTYRDEIVGAVALEQNMPNMTDTLTHLARRAPRGYAAHAYSVAALAYYLHGDGIAAMTAVDHANAADPRYTLARLIEASLRAGIPPYKIREFIADTPPAG